MTIIKRSHELSPCRGRALGGCPRRRTRIRNAGSTLGRTRRSHPYVTLVKWLSASIMRYAGGSTLPLLDSP